MKKLCAVLFVGTLIAPFACGGKVLVDGVRGDGGGGGAGGSGPAACPSPPDDQDVQKLVGKACNVEAMVCASNNGCGGCSVTCKDGAWVSTDTMLCFSIGPTC
jgi:hypothetical protein